MTEKLPAPLVPADVDLRDFAFMPLEVARLRRSKAWLIAKRSPELGFYMLNLWAAAWHDRPAGSLEDDDDVLADLAMCDPKRWTKVRDQALHGWVKCSDGRLYHPVVAEKVTEAWARKQGQRQRTEAARQARLQRQSPKPTETVTTTVTAPVTTSVTDSVTEIVTDNVTASKGQGQGQGQGQKEERGRVGAEPPTPPPDPEPDDLLAIPDSLDRTACGKAVQAWNRMADGCGLPRVQRLTDSRGRKLKARLAECGGLDGWNAALAKVQASPFLCGDNDRKWRADIDFMLRESRFTSLMEGKYDGPGHGGNPGKFKNGFAQLLAEELDQRGGGMDLPDGRPAGRAA